LNLDTVTVGDFAPAVGESFSLDAGEAGTLELELTAAVAASHPGPEGTRHPFTLEFLGPADLILPQSIYRLEHEALGTLEIFIVPVGRDDAGTAYEAVFN
jgi:hypothetical protein